MRSSGRKDGEIEKRFAITVKDIAARVGVSPSTVSRALSDSPDVAEETKQKVLQMAEDLKYTPNLLARGLARASTSIIGFLFLDLANPFYVPVARAMEDVAEEGGYMVMIGESRRIAQTEEKIIERFRTIRVAGVIITPVLHSTVHLERLKREGTPVVVLGRTCENLDYVSGDNVSGGHMVGRHLLGLGYRRIGIVMSGEPTNRPEEERSRGLKRALEEGGLSYEKRWTIAVGNNRIEGGVKAADILLEMEERPRAIFAMTDLLAIGLTHRLRERGLQVPEDVAVVGFDDNYFAEFCEVPLTTVYLPKAEFGEIAARMLLEKLQGRSRVKKIEHVLLQPELVVRKSCGAVRISEK